MKAKQSKYNEITLEYKRTRFRLKRVCETINEIDCKILVIVGRTGSGKSTIVDRLCDKVNIFYGSPSHSLQNNPPQFDLVETSGKYAVLDDCSQFTEASFTEFLSKAQQASKVPVLTLQDLQINPPHILAFLKQYQPTVVFVQEKMFQKQEY